MEGVGVYDDSRMTSFLLKTERATCTPEVLDALWVPTSSPSFHGSASIVNFEDVRGEKSAKRPFFTRIDSKVENVNEGFDGCSHQPEKKRRLSPDQVQFLEKCFDVENKLEPERKAQLSKQLDLQPRQVAIWFQNRRARCKTKLLEKEYDSLKAGYEKLKADYDTLYKENEKLRSEVHLLTEKLLLRENGKLKPETCDPISPLDFQPKGQIFSPDVAPVMACKQEDAASSAKSDVVDSDSPRCCTDGFHSALLLEPANSSHAFEADGSEFSHDEDDSLSRSLLPTPGFPKLEVEYCDDLQPNSCNLGFPVQDQGTWFWQY